MNLQRIRTKPTSKMDQKKTEVLKVSRSVFSELGIESTKMTDIAKNAGIGVATVYRYFNNKTTLVIATGIYSWKCVNDSYEPKVKAILKKDQKAIDKLEQLLKLYYNIFLKEKGFIRFLDEFDNYIVNNKISPKHLEVYEREVLRIQPYTKKIYQEGLNDCTIRKVKDFKVLNNTISHALMTLSQKALIRNKIIASDDAKVLLEEVKLLIEIMVEYARR